MAASDFSPDGSTVYGALKDGAGTANLVLHSDATGVQVVATRDEFEALGLAPEIKWPNDVLLAGRKFCGILTEADGDTVVIGIGLNVAGTAADFPAGVEATTLAESLGEAVARELVLERVWHSLGRVLRRPTGDVAEGVWVRLAWKDARVLVRVGGKEEAGEIRAFGPGGELLVQTQDGLQAVSDVSSLRLAER